MCGPTVYKCDSEEFRLRVVEKADVVGKDYGLIIFLTGVCGEECRFAFIGVEDNLLGDATFPDGGDHTIYPPLFD